MTVRHWFMLAAVLLVTSFVYKPGIGGGYLFDDVANFVDNPSVHVTTLSFDEWRRAADGSPSPVLRRPVAFLSLAINYYFTGLDPAPVKLTNLIIHLLNGVLLWQVLRQLLRLRPQRVTHGHDAPSAETIALLLTTAWLLAPINVTGVLYVIQRMASLAQTFVLLGLMVYLHGRRRMMRDGSGVLLSASGIIGGVGLGVLSKETAVLLPIYAFLLEITVLRFAAATRRGRYGLWGIHAALLLVPGAVFLVLIAPRWLTETAYIHRTFTLDQRLLTEARVLVDYMRWTLFPDPNTLSFYHDDLAVSTGWLSPISTALCAALIATLLCLAVLTRNRLPLVSLGIGWYFAAHLLTATVIPLELVFEHRNYFASIGLLLAVCGLLLELPEQLNLARSTLVFLALAWFSTVTYLRAQEWSDPITLAFAEASKHPESPRANYQLGQTLIAASNYQPDSKYLEPGIAAFERAARIPTSSAWAYAALIAIHGRLGREIPDAWWQGTIDKLHEQPPSAESIAALEALESCQEDGSCPSQPQPMLAAFLAALSHPAPPWQLLAAYGGFAANVLKDYVLAERVFQDAARKSRGNIDVLINLAKTQLLQRNLVAASSTLAAIEPKSVTASQQRQVEKLKALIADRDANGPQRQGKD